MNEEMSAQSFRLARMCPLVRTLTVVLLALPIAFLAGALFGRQLLAVPAVFLLALYAWVWLRFRPSRLTVCGAGLEVILAAQAPRDSPRGHRKRASGQPARAEAGDRMGRAGRRGRTVGWLRLALDDAAGVGPDVCHANRLFRVDRVRSGQALAGYAGGTRGICSRALALEPV